MSTGKRIRAGHVIEIGVPGGTAYAQYVGEHPSLGGTLLLDPTVQAEPLPDTSRFDGTRGYYVFYPVRAAVRAGLVTVHSAAPLGDAAVPERLRRAGARSPDGRVLTWVVVDRSGQSVFERLEDEQRMLPIGAIWNHEMLVHRIAEGWRPEREG